MPKKNCFQINVVTFSFCHSGAENEDGGYYHPVPTTAAEVESEDPKMKAASEVLDKAMLKIDD